MNILLQVEANPVQMCLLFFLSSSVGEFKTGLLGISINLPAFYYECHSLICFATHYLQYSVIDSE